MKQQLVMDLAFQLEATFDFFYVADNDMLTENLKQFTCEKTDQHSQQLLYLHGQTGVGKSHLLQAICHYADKHNIHAQYLPVEQLLKLSPEFTHGLESTNIILIDDVHLLAGNSEWQQTLFDLINRCLEAGNKMVFSALKPADQLALSLPDLVSRLNWGQKWALKSLSDEQRKAMLFLRSKARAIPMTDELANYIVLRCQQDNASIMNCLERLDRESLTEKRKLTIPFVKQVMSW